MRYTGFNFTQAEQAESAASDLQRGLTAPPEAAFAEGLDLLFSDLEQEATSKVETAQTTEGRGALAKAAAEAALAGALYRDAVYAHAGSSYMRKLGHAGAFQRILAQGHAAYVIKRHFEKRSA